MLTNLFKRKTTRRSGQQFTGRRRAHFDHLENRQMLAAHIVGGSTSYSTIQAAVNAAVAGQTITVDAGTYNETVTVNKQLTIQGAEAGIDARTNVRRENGVETIVTGAAVGGSTPGVGASFIIAANDVTLDGFTVQGETSQNLAIGAGIVISPNLAGTHILNNIVQNNVSGMFLANNSATDAAVVQHNIFRNNNNVGENGGRGIYTDQTTSGGLLTNVDIDGNYFYNNRGSTGTTGLEAACAFESTTNASSQTNITIINNTFDTDGKAVLFFNTTGALFSNNVVTHCLDWYSGLVRFEGNDHNVTITYNTLFYNTGPAVAVDTKGFPGDNSGFVVNYNNIYGNGTTSGSNYGVCVNGNVYDGVFDARFNYWGSASGPSGDGPGTGDSIYGIGHVVSGQSWAVTKGAGSELYNSWLTAPQGNPDTAYWGTPSTDGAKIQAEDFDMGGQGYAYNEVDTIPNTTYRYGGVDIESTSDTGGGYDVTKTAAGEWLDYAVNLTQGGTYSLAFRMASASAGATFHVLVDGVNVSGTLAVPSTGGTQAWTTLTAAGIALTSGNHTVRIVFDTNNAGKAGPNFNWFTMTNTAPVANPTAPTGLGYVIKSSNEVDLSWTDTSAGQTGVLVQRSMDGTNYTTIATLAGTANSYADTSASPVTTYYYRVEAQNAGGNSNPSNVVTMATPPSSTQPTYLSSLNWTTATAGYGVVQKNADINGTPITLRGTKYASGIGTHAQSTIVYQLNGQYGTFTSDVGVDDDTAGAGHIDFQIYGDGKLLADSGVLAGTSPIVTLTVDVTGVQALTLMANPGVSGSIDYDHADWAGARLLVAAPPVAAPSNLTVTAAVSSSVINLAWTNNATNASSYSIDRSTDGVTFATIANLPSTPTSYADTNLTAGTTYYYRIRANSISSTSPNSAVVSATTTAANAVLTSLSSLNWTSATTGYGTVHKNATINGNTITLRGTTYGTGIGTHAASTITYTTAGQYTNFISDVGIDDEESGNGSVDFQVVGDGKVLFDSGVLAGTSPVVHLNVNITGVQTLQIIATNGVTGSIDYDHADWAGATLISTPSLPAAPSGLTAAASSTSLVYLAWTNNASNQTGFTIQRSTDGTNFGTIATVGAGVTTYADSAGLAAGTTYYYRVLATNAQGPSAASNTAATATLAANAVTTNLSSLTWTSATTGYGSVQKNSTVNGNTITLRGMTYASGIGTHAVSTITYNLNKGYSNFISDVGVDDEEGGQGAVDFKVVGDGVTLFDSGVLTGTSPVVHLNVSVAGVTTLQLIATNGVSGSIDYDHSDWAAARLIASPSVPSAPANISAVAVSTSVIDLAWQNTAANQTGFAIDRSTDGTNFTPLATVSSSTNIYTDSNLSAGTAYYYRVRATNNTGTSPASPIVSATTVASGAVVTPLDALVFTSATAGYGTVQVDSTIKGNTITLRGTTYGEGLGTHAPSTITYNLAGKYTNFISDVGIDDEVGGQGAVDFQVVGDGNVLWDSGVLTGASAAAHVNVNVTGVQTLQLLATNPVPGNIDYDHSDWAGVELISSGSTTSPNLRAARLISVSASGDNNSAPSNVSQVVSSAATPTVKLTVKQKKALAKAQAKAAKAAAKAAKLAAKAAAKAQAKAAREHKILV